MSDDEAELVAFAVRIGMKVSWLQRDSFGLPHFDATGRFMRTIQVESAVEKLDRREFVERYRALKQARIEAVVAARAAKSNG